MYKDRVFGFSPLEYESRATFYWFRLNILDTQLRAESHRNCQIIVQGVNPWLKLSVSLDRIWLGASPDCGEIHNIHMNNCDLLDTKLSHEAFVKSMQAKYPDYPRVENSFREAHDFFSRFVILRFATAPVADARDTMSDIRTQEQYIEKHGRYTGSNAFLPAGNSTYKTFLLHDKPTIQVWTTQLVWEQKFPLIQTTAPNKAPDEIIPSAFSNDHFSVFEKSQTYFFWTQSDRIYVAKKPARGQRKMELVWDEPQRLLTHIIRDSESNRTFFFGKDHTGAKQERNFYFELDEKLKIVEFRPGDLKPIKGDEPGKTVMQYTTLLKEREKIGNGR